MKKGKEKVATEELKDQAEVQEKQAEKQAKKEVEKEDEKKEEPSLDDQLDEAKDKYLRLYSEFENFRRRTTKERSTLIKTANKDLMTELLPVIDDFDRAMAVSKDNQEDQSFKEGIVLIQNKLNKTLESNGLKKMEVKKGDAFDDEKHEAITQIPAEKKLAGKVVDVVEAGYYLGETVVRFAKVVVGAKQ